MNSKFRYLTFSFILFLAIRLNVFAQEAITPRPSPAAIITMKYDETYVKLTYCQPHKRGRAIFGGLVPYGHVWRTGANEATEITLTGDILINGDTLNAGTYSIFSIPQQNQWTIIVNEELGQWGSYNYNKDADVIRFDVPTQKIQGTVWEPFTITFEQKNDTANLLMMWDQTKVTIPIQFLKP
ncbi:DUF2911 domain-containing protein [Fulvivirga sp. 29W222]|uniref:DUF2911 domain-containing protein n=1 Tax=Fulvivirga marina TaxID=2494733 RepID=A0A937FZZ1_9BACT|nr:DUF2911 domain-containing protein [Fulvivirga marina]MBL6449260.1 DUF2911 domain-containing protein [Fulvivirga marina]